MFQKSFVCYRLQPSSYLWRREKKGIFLPQIGDWGQSDEKRNHKPNRQRHGKTTPHHHKRGVRKRKGIDRQPEAAERPAGVGDGLGA